MALTLWPGRLKRRKYPDPGDFSQAPLIPDADRLIEAVVHLEATIDGHFRYIETVLMQERMERRTKNGLA